MPTLRSARQIERDKLFFKLGGVTNLLGFRPLAKPEMAKNNGPYLETTEAFRRFARVWGTEAIDKFAEYSAGPLLTPGENAHRRVTEWLAASRRHPARPLVAVCPYSNCTSKNIPAACIPDLIYQLEAELKLEVVIMGGRKDAAEADNAVRQSGVGLNACGAFSIEESAALLKSCRLAVAADSGPMHLAGAVGVPLIAVFSRYDSPLGKWFPLGVDNTILFRDVECAGCRAAACPVQGHPCMSDIKVDHIVAAVAGKIFGLSVLPSSLNGTRMVDWTSEVSVRQ
jgi:ADP-heptose:LPS heptosyltransferase